MITASRPGCRSVSPRSEVQCGICHFSANAFVPSGRPPVIEITSTSGMFWMACMWRSPNAPPPASATFIVQTSLCGEWHRLGHDPLHVRLAEELGDADGARDGAQKTLRLRLVAAQCAKELLLLLAGWRQPSQ